MGLLSVAIWLPIAFGVVLLAIGRDDLGEVVRRAPPEAPGLEATTARQPAIDDFIGLREGWQAAVWTLTAASALMFVLAAWRVPAKVQAPGADFSGLGALLRRRDVQAVLLITALYFTAVFTVFSSGLFPPFATTPPAAGADTPSLAVPSDISDAADGSLLPSAPAAPVRASPWTLSALEM